MKSILLADDETQICAELEQTLARFKFHVEAAHTVETALRRIQGAHFDAVLLEFDLRSDRKDHPRTGAGLEVARQLRASGTRVPILMFTAVEGKLYEAASLEAGADDFVRKIDGIPRLLARLRAHIRRNEHEAGRELAHRFGRFAPMAQKVVRAPAPPR